MRTEELYRLYLRHPLISTDSRNDVSGSLFFCLKGENFDGNAFAMEAMNKGAAFVIYDGTETLSGERFIHAGNALAALQDLAALHRDHLKIPVIGITGTNGKTTTKELVEAILKKKYRVAATQGNLNNHIGVPLTLLSAPKDAEIAVVEMGANHPGEIAELCAIAKPDHGIITNVGKAHLQGFGDIKHILQTKTALYRSVAAAGGKLFVNADDATLMQEAGTTDRLTYGRAAANFCPGKMLAADPYISVAWGAGYKNELQTQLIGSYNLENILAAACTGLYFGVDESHINEAMQHYHPSNMRSQFRQTADNKVIVDAYNANPTSMIAAIENFAHITGNDKVAILGDMLELGESKEEEHLEVLKKLKGKAFDQIILIGPVFMKVNPYKEFLCFEDAEKALRHLGANPLKNACILLKGSRGIKMEKVLDAL